MARVRLDFVLPSGVMKGTVKVMVPDSVQSARYIESVHHLGREPSCQQYSSTVSDLNKKIYKQIESWRNRPIEGEHPMGEASSCS